MSINVAQIMQLARLEGSSNGLVDDLTRILGMVNDIQTIDTTGIEAMNHPLNAEQRLRPDVVTETNQRDEFLKLAPSHAAGLFLVPEVIPGVVE